MSEKLVLETSAIYELDFLKEASRIQFLDDPEVVKVSAWRYENFRLPLLDEISSGGREDLQFLPPIDVHWIWHCHMLSPTDYIEDCKEIFERVFDHQGVCIL